MSQHLISYSELIDHAMRGVVREVLREVQKNGLPGEHYFYITFRTDHPEARVSDTLKTRYPHEMTIVLQHQFWDFRVEEHKFHVTLSFGGVPERLEIPFISMTAFADPSVKFGLQFQQPPALTARNKDILSPLSYENEKTMDSSTGAEDSAAEIISLDAFRKK